MDISEDQLREGVKQIGINEWHANVIVELLRITRNGYVSGVSSAVKKSNRKGTHFILDICQRVW